MAGQQRITAFDRDEIGLVRVDHGLQFLEFGTVQDISRLGIKVGHTVQDHPRHALTDRIDRIAFFLDDLDQGFIGDDVVQLAFRMIGLVIRFQRMQISLVDSCICGKILLCVCVCVCVSLTSFGDALPACQGTDEHIWSSDCFHGKRQLGLSLSLYLTWVCLSLGSLPTGECSLVVLACFDGLVVQTCSAEVRGSYNTRFAVALL